MKVSIKIGVILPFYSRISNFTRSLFADSMYIIFAYKELSPLYFRHLNSRKTKESKLRYRISDGSIPGEVSVRGRRFLQLLGVA